MIELGVNIDHVATLRQARRTWEPDPVWAAVEAHLGGADGITLGAQGIAASADLGYQVVMGGMAADTITVRDQTASTDLILGDNGELLRKARGYATLSITSSVPESGGADTIVSGRGDKLVIGGREWEVITGYGHSPEHSSLYCAEAGVLISGDMLLPRISTNVSVFAAAPDDDPLGRFLASIRGFERLPEASLVLPSHGSPFRNIGLRVAQLIEHHDARCAELLAACAEPRSAGELLSTLFPRPLDTHQVMFAMGEAIAHLNHLEHKGEVRKVEGIDGIVRFVKSN